MAFHITFNKQQNLNIMKRLTYLMLVLFISAMSFSTITSCKEQKKDPGEKIEEAVDDIGDGLEEAGDDVKDAAEEVGEEIEETVDNNN